MNNLVRYTNNDPFFGIFDDFFRATPVRTPTRTNRQVRVENFDDRTEISVAAPGVSSESFTVDLNSNTLTVGYTAGDEDDTHFAKNAFTRSWRVQDGTEADDITAAHNNGVLTVTVAVPESTSTTTSIPVN